MFSPRFLVVAAFSSTLVRFCGARPQPSTRRSELANSSTSGKYVVAHHIVGNTYDYTTDDWSSDIQLAYDCGLDGFALNVGSDYWESSYVADAYTAAEDLGLNFKLFISFDMTSLAFNTVDDAAALRDYVTSYASNDYQLKINDHILITTFAGSDCTIQYIPGDLNQPIFDSAITSELKEYLEDLTSSDGVITYIAAVSPWLFTHYGVDSYDKNPLLHRDVFTTPDCMKSWVQFIYLADYHLWNARWETIIENRDDVDIVEIPTWNDYGESHYIGPIEGDQPNSQDWVDVMPHEGWLAMLDDYATVFRSGIYPEITEDQLYIWARPHPKLATASDDSVGDPTNYQLMEDVLWAAVFAKASATVELTTSVTTTITVPSGVAKTYMVLATGYGMSGKIIRDDDTVVSVDPGDAYTFEADPEYYNLNAYVAYAKA
ncbi:glycoside hydrolase family 71 protein [Laetiporus sulphureus 93-53]|uniref:Glycoside hydrolase family 71 protein n=1 Tax=Laetiporus sulphureus 93-53 TaxID=1314785 RepID=A0A165BM58_9APHY|nr:glycoside hydrolase family 71 protein [Laetiporus sulphureus 93-53]KZT01299.1 glycoside hydrolase family 71 protein [Laetiporus sulphureus 93-53]